MSRNNTSVENDQIIAGQAIYTRRTLPLYDLVVLGFSNRLIWRCPTPQLLAHYNRHVTANHLDVGVGTGYFLDHCHFQSDAPRLALMDMNQEALNFTAARIARFAPETYQQNVLEPIRFDIRHFDSVAVNYLLHCLPGSMKEKAIVFDHLMQFMRPHGILFGSTLLHDGVKVSAPGRRLMDFYNRKGIFSNAGDRLHELRGALESRFHEVEIRTIGCAALFSARRH